MRKIISIAGLPCCGKTTLCNNIAKSFKGISLDLEYLRTKFFNENLDQNVYKYTKNEPIKENEDLRDYFLRCVIYEQIVSLDEYVNWYKIIMNYINQKLNELINDYDMLEYDEFLLKYNNVIKYSPKTKSNLLVINHALLPLTDIWAKGSLSIFLVGEKQVLASRFAQREKIDLKKYEKDIYRHFNLYDILNKNAKFDFSYDTTSNFLTVEEVIEFWRERGEEKDETRN